MGQAGLAISIRTGTVQGVPGGGPWDGLSDWEEDGDPEPAARAGRKLLGQLLWAVPRPWRRGRRADTKPPISKTNKHDNSRWAGLHARKESFHYFANLTTATAGTGPRDSVATAQPPLLRNSRGDRKPV